MIRYEKPVKPSRYTPDFVIERKDGTKFIVETKGRFVTEDRQKHLLIRSQHPTLDIRFVFSDSLTRISKQSKTTYADWCAKHDFLYADKFIPEAWLKE